MTNTQGLSDEATAQAARSAALDGRPKSAPAPTRLAAVADYSSQWRAATQFYEMANGYYASGDYKLGDYCLARGDSHKRFALLGESVNRDLLPADEVTQAGSADGAPEAHSLAQLLELRANARLLRNPEAPQLPSVAVEHDAPPCQAHATTAAGYVLLTVGAYQAGDDEAGAYYMSLADAWIALYQACVATTDTLS